jgi:hypothetical protein
MPKYKVKFYGDYERRLKEKTMTIEAANEEEARTKAWKTHPEYKEMAVWEEDE